MSVTIEYAKLNLQDALDLAILIEEEACERYKEFAEHIGNRYEVMLEHFSPRWRSTKQSTENNFPTVGKTVRESSSSRDSGNDLGRRSA